MKPRIGVTLTEVMLALVIMAMAMIPISGLMTQNVKDTDVLVSHSFAIDRTRLILNTLIDSVAFRDLKSGIPAVLSGPGSASLSQELFPGSSAVGGGYACLGEIKDSRGISFQALLRVDDISDPSPGYTDGEFYFSYYPNPTVEKHPGWSQLGIIASQTEDGNEPSKFSQTVGPNNPFGAISAYRFFDLGIATITSGFWGPETEVGTNGIRIDQRQVSQPVNGVYCLMKRLIFEIRWNLAMSEYRNPLSTTGRPQRLYVVTFKANLD